MFFEYEYFIVIFMMIITVVYSLKVRQEKAPVYSLVSPDTSHVMKALCCIIIILHHWAFRGHSPYMEKVLTGFGGGYSLSVFFMLSTYGIAKSEMKKPLDVISYTKHRMWKIIKPYLAVVMLMMVSYWLIRADYPIVDLAKYRVSEYFILIGQHQLEIVDYLMLILNGKSLSFHFWFVEVTLVSYIYFFIAKSVFDINKHRLMLFSSYSALLIATAVTLMLTIDSFPYLAFVRNVPMMLLGLLLALYEKEICHRKKNLLKLYITFNICTAAYTFVLENSFNYTIYTNYAILSIWMLNNILSFYQLKKDSPVMLLSALSYVIYLIHASVLTVEWWYIGFRSVLMAVVCSVGMAYIYKCVTERKITRINIITK